MNGIVNTNSYTDSSGDTGTAGQVLSSTGVSGTNWIDDPNPTPYSWLVEADAGTGSPYTVLNGNTIHFKGDTNISTAWDNTNKEVLISLSGTSITGSGVANQVTYWDGTQTITGAAGLTFAGGATGKVAIGGELEVGGVLTDGTFTGSSGTYTGFASISSTVFVGPLQGNADTATALINAGTVSMSGDTVAAGVTYTSGGNVPLVSTISDSVVYNKELSGFNATSGSVQNGDSIIEALERLQGQITTLPQGLVYQGVWSAAGTGGGTPDLTVAGTKVNGHFYICDTAGTAAPNGAGNPPNDWDVRDWVIFADDGAGGGVDEWQKIDNSSLAGGTGTPNTMTKWLTNQTIGNSNITDDGSVVTIADTINFTTQGNNTFGNTSADVSSFLGNVTLSENLILAKGLSLGSSYGTAGQVLTSGGGIGVANTWTTPTTGTVTSVGYTHQGDAFTVGGVPVTSSGVIAVTMAGSASQYINGVGNLTTFPTVDNYVSWTADSDEGTDITVTSGFNLKFTGAVTAGGAGIATDSAISANEMTIGLINAGGTPGATTFYRGDGQWSVPVGTKTETLAEVLVNGNTTGSTFISVTNANINFQDSSAVGNGRARFGTGNDLQIYHDGSNSYINEVGTGVLSIQSDGTEVQINKGSSEYMARFITDGAVNLYHNNVKKFETTSAGISVTGGITTATGNFSDNVYLSAGQLYLGASDSNTDDSYRMYATSGQFVLASRESGTWTTRFDIDTSGNATFEDNVEIKGNLTVDGNIIHGSGGGIFNGDQAITVAGGATLAFTLTRTTTGTMVFDVWLTSETGTASSVAKKYVVAHSYNSTPVYNKIIDTGPGTGNTNTDDFTVQFIDSGVGATGTSCKCILTAVGAAQNIGYTVQVGHDSTNALTFTAAS